MTDIGSKIAGFFAAIISLAVIGVILSTRANTTGVLSTVFGGVSNLIGVAISPITGQQISGLTAGLTGPASGTSWQTPVINYAGQTGSISTTSAGGSLGVSTPGFSVNLTGAGSLLNSVGNLFNSTGGGSGVVDTGTF